MPPFKKYQLNEEKYNIKVQKMLIEKFVKNNSQSNSIWEFSD